MNPITSIAGHRQIAVRLPRRVLARRSDEQLMELVQNGDANAFETLYERHATGVLSFCRHMLGSQEEAEEALQRSFVSVHLGILQASGGQVSFKPWIYTIARNHCGVVLRERRVKRPVRAAEISTAGLRQEVEQRDDLRELLADIERLPELQREAFVLTELRDLSLEQVAEVLDREPTAVKGLVFRARSTMIERREARRVDCLGVRESLQTAGDRDLARGPLRYHLDICPDCSDYLGALHRQRRLLGLALPVIPALALKKSVMTSVGAGGTGAGVGAGAGAGTSVGVGMGSGAGAGAGGVAGGAAAGAAATSGASLAGSGVLAKVAMVGVLAGGTGVAAEAVHHTGARAAVEPAPAAVHEHVGSRSDWLALGVPVPGLGADPLAPQVVAPGGAAPIAAHPPATATVPLATPIEAPIAGDHLPATEPDELSPEVDPAFGDPLDLSGGASAEEVSVVEIVLDEPAPEGEPAVVDVAPIDVPAPTDPPPVDLPPVELPPVDLPPVEVAPVEVVPAEAPADPPPADDLPADPPSADASAADDGGEGESEIGDSPPPEPPPA
ncbi:MAG TPA: RNA polymerase sigma factor [Thermoleophilaceae bacterium]|nr:RNA polymerase sigma factor [Thermoleophilaceae bacterium]